MTKITINEKERIVLEILAEEWSSDSNCFYFKGILSRLNQRIEGGAKIPIMGIPEIRRACRSLARKELAQFHRGLFDEDGQVAGSGYCATEKGAAMISPCDVCGELAIYDYEIDEKGEQTFNDGVRVLECEEHYKKSPKLTPKLL